MRRRGHRNRRQRQRTPEETNLTGIYPVRRCPPTAGLSRTLSPLPARWLSLDAGASWAIVKMSALEVGRAVRPGAAIRATTGRRPQPLAASPPLESAESLGMPWTIPNLLLHDKPAPLLNRRGLGCSKVWVADVGQTSTGTKKWSPRWLSQDGLASNLMQLS